MASIATTTVRDLAVGISGATRIFEGLKIDYCCGGSKTLEDACALRGLKTEDVSQLLENAGLSGETTDATIDVQAASLTELITYIVDKHHVFTKAEMTRLEGLTEKVCSVHGQNHPELLRVKALFHASCEDLRPHMMKEEQVLFPYIVALEEAAARNQTPATPAFGTVRNPVRMMMLEHEKVGELLCELRGVTTGYSVPDDGCISYRTLYQALEAFEQDLHQHIHLENNILFPRALEMESMAYSACP